MAYVTCHFTIKFLTYVCLKLGVPFFGSPCRYVYVYSVEDPSGAKYRFCRGQALRDIGD